MSGLSSEEELICEIECLKEQNEKLRAEIKEVLRVTGLDVIADRVIKLHALINSGH